MNAELFRLINDFKKNRRLISFDEAATKQVVILRILKSLGWDPFNIDEIYPEYSVGVKRVDYALRHNGRNKVFIEVKKVNEDLEKHQEQLLNYSFQEGVKLAILTNGISWWFYLPLREGSWEQRKFYTIEIFDQNSEDIVNKFEDFLAKANVISDRAIENAENLYKSRQKHYLIEETLPKAWNKIITEPDDLLVELLADTTEKLCGYKPDNEIVEKFLMKVNQRAVIQIKREVSNLEQLSSDQISHPLSVKVSGKSIIAFALKGTRYPVSSWREMLIKITNLILSNHRGQFDKVFNLRGRKRPYFTRNPNELRIPKKINNTDIYVETNLSANSIVKLSKSIISLFGYKENDLSIEIR
ncbi:type I restriction endonuclease [Deferribacter abyssi]|uniref:type I restriction endonuclease n=1 Tax=Deferribacter abyssi TaxID=213806 RepID=UPI003C27CDCF